MTYIILLLIAIVILVFIYTQQKKTLAQKEIEIKDLNGRVAALSQYEDIKNIDSAIMEKQKELDGVEAEYNAKAQSIMDAAQAELDKAKSLKKDILAQAEDKAAAINEKANVIYTGAQRQAEHIITKAQEEAKTIAGEAYTLKEKADENTAIAQAMENRIYGYGNKYIIPGRTLIDDLADTYGYSKVSEDYKSIQAQITAMIENRTAGECDYVEPYRKRTAIDFVVDAFNGRVASIMSRVRSGNYGKLRQEMMDARTLVDKNGQAFRCAHITYSYLDLNFEELRLATMLYEMKEKDKEEQRAIRDQMREEEKARREIERAMKDAAKQEELIQAALAKAREKYAAANEEQKAKYETQLSELEAKLKEAEEKNQKAISMAQQTKRGHVYVISNVGSFGEDIYKIGMTRRLEPLDRIRELGDASVPFPFDVHAMIWSEDAPSLETSLHKHFAINQVNKINARKEFYRAPIHTIREEIESLGVKNISWTMLAQAKEYQDTLALEKMIEENPAVRDAWINREETALIPAAAAEDNIDED